MTGRRCASPPGARELVLVAACYVLGIAVRLPTIGQPLLEVHSFRQTQTAFAAVLFASDGIDLLHPRVPVLGPPYEVIFEFPLFQALAAIPIRLGIPADMSLRLTCLLSFFVSALLLWLLVRRVATPPAAFATLVAYVFSPFALVWSRTSMIEYLVIAFALAYVLAAIAWRDVGGARAWLVAVVAGALAMMIKITSAGIWILPVIAYRSRKRSLRDPRLLALVVLPLGAALLWTRYADAQRAAAPGTEWMTAINMAPFLLGTTREHLDPAVWATIAFYGGAWSSGPALVGLAIGSAQATRDLVQRRFWGAVILAPLGSIFVFLNLWFLHDYYRLAATPSIAVAIGLAGGWLWERRDVRLVALVSVPGVATACLYLTQIAPPAIALAPAALFLAVLAEARRRRVHLVRHARPVMVASALAALALGLAITFQYWGVAYASSVDTVGVLSRAAELARLTRPDEDVLVVGRDWSPDLLYYARRRGQMLPQDLLQPSFVETLDRSRYRTMLSWKPSTDPLWPASPWRWIGAIGPHTYALGSSPADLREAPIAATDDLSAFAGASRRGRALTTAPLVLPCGDVKEFAAGSSGTWLRLDVAPAGARVGASRDLAAVPARAVVFVARVSALDDVLHLACAGTGSITILEIVDAPPAG